MPMIPYAEMTIKLSSGDIIKHTELVNSDNFIDGKISEDIACYYPIAYNYGTYLDLEEDGVFQDFSYDYVNGIWCSVEPEKNEEGKFCIEWHDDSRHGYKTEEEAEKGIRIARENFDIRATINGEEVNYFSIKGKDIVFISFKNYF